VSRALLEIFSDLQPSKKVAALAESLLKMEDGVAAPTTDAKTRVGGGMWASEYKAPLFCLFVGSELLVKNSL
jgi:hypothetical protein